MNTLARYTAKDMGDLVDQINRYSVGFDDLFYRLASYDKDRSTYPPYNIIKESDTKWRLELALAGWSQDEVEVSTETNVLTVSSKTGGDETSGDYVHRGVARRTFSRGFNLSDDVEVGEVRFTNGLLQIDLVRIIPDHQKKKIYKIESAK